MTAPTQKKDPKDLSTPKLLFNEPAETADKFRTYLMVLERYELQVTNALNQFVAAKNSRLKIISNAKGGKKDEEGAAYTQMSATRPWLLTDLEDESEALIDIQCAKKSAQALLHSLSLCAQSDDAAPLLQNVSSIIPSAQQSTTSSDRATDERGNNRVAAPVDSEQSVNLRAVTSIQTTEIHGASQRLADFFGTSTNKLFISIGEFPRCLI